MTLSDLITRVNYRRRDTTQSFISEEEIRTYLNDALNITQQDGEYDWSRTSANLSYTDGIIRYPLSAYVSDLKEPISLFHSNVYQIERVQPAEFYRLSSSGSDIYAIDNRDILLKTTFGSGDVKLEYYSYNTAQTSAGSWIDQLSASDDQPLMPLMYQSMLIEYADALCNRKEGNADDYTSAYTAFMKQLNSMKGDLPSQKQRPLSRMRHINELGAGISWSQGKDNPLGQ